MRMNSLAIKIQHDQSITSQDQQLLFNEMSLSFGGGDITPDNKCAVITIEKKFKDTSSFVARLKHKQQTKTANTVIKREGGNKDVTANTKIYQQNRSR